MKRIEKLRQELRKARQALRKGLRSRHEMYWSQGARIYTRHLEAEIELCKK